MIAVRAGMSLEEFWESTPWAIRIYAAAYGERIRDQQEVLAGFFATLINATHQGKRPLRLTPRKLIGSRRPIADAADYRTEEEFLEASQALKEKPQGGNVW